MSATISLKWKRVGRKYRGDYELVLPLVDMDIRRPEGRLKGRFILRSPLIGSGEWEDKLQANRRMPFKDAGRIGLDVKNARLELRWEATSNKDWNWFCCYELVIPTLEGDILRARLGGTKVGGSRPPVREDGTVDTPFRDGAHAKWDGKTLGVRAWAIFGDKRTLLPLIADKDSQSRTQ